MIALAIGKCAPMKHLGAFLVRHSKLLIAAILIIAATYVYSQLPPSKIIIGTGPKGGFFETAGEAYKNSLAKHGVEVELQGRDDAASIIDAVEDPKSGVDVGFAAQSIDKSNYNRVKSLGAVSYEPFSCSTEKNLAAPRTSTS